LSKPFDEANNNGSSVFLAAPFISDHVAACQSSGNAERNSESFRDLMSVGYFANRGKIGKWTMAAGGDY
jgi:hypothetical protein